jgi:signal peptidase I
MRRTAAIVGSLILAPAGPIVLGHPKRAAASFAVELLGIALFVAGALWRVTALLLLAVLVLLLVRVAMVRAAVRLPPVAQPPRAGRVVLLLLLLALFERTVISGVREHLVEAFRIPAASMIPTLQIGDHMFIDKRATSPRRGDVIVFRYPREPNKNFIKRVIALGGDTVEWRDGFPLVNGRPLDHRDLDGDCRYSDYDDEHDRWEERTCRAFEESLDGRTWRVVTDRQPREGAWPLVRVPDGSYYVVGDNRDNSHDSRFFGTIPANHVKGTALYIYWSSGHDGLAGERIGLAVR